MDNTTKGFAQKIISELESIKHALALRQEHKQANTLASQSAEQTQVPRPHFGPTSESDVPPTTTSNNNPSNRQQQRREMWKFRVEIGGAIVLLAYSAFAALQWYEMKKSVETMNKQMRVSARPWVGLTDETQPVQTGLLSIDSDGNPNVSYAIASKNFGTTGAQDVMANASLVISEDHATIISGQAEACSDIFIGKKGFGLVLFPGKANTVMQSSGRYPKEKLKSGHEDGKFQAWLVGCVGFRDQFNFLYKTSFIYRYVDPRTQQAIRFAVTPNASIAGTFMLYHTAFE